MANILVDPVIVMTLSDDASRDEVERWLSILDTWLGEALNGHFTWLHAVPVSNLLQDNRRFPSFESLRGWQRKYHLDISPTQIVRQVNEFFRNEGFDLGRRLEQLGYLIEPEADSIFIQPDEFASRWPNFVRDLMYLLLATTCACKYNEESFGHEMRIATLALDNDVKEIEVTFVISDVLPENFPLPPDRKIAQTFPLLITPEDLIPLVDVISLWAKGMQSIVYAIEQEAKKIMTRSASKPKAFKLGRCFIESVEERGLHTDTKTLRNIIDRAARVIAEQEGDLSLNKEPFDESKGNYRKNKLPSGKQRIRPDDQAKAWRIHVSKHGAGWRLQYWEIPTPEGSIIEFANVSEESVREICE